MMAQPVSFAMWIRQLKRGRTSLAALIWQSPDIRGKRGEDTPIVKGQRAFFFADEQQPLPVPVRLDEAGTMVSSAPSSVVW